MLFTVTCITTGIFALLCLLALPLWILGIPGIDNEYARGWKLGLSTLLLYPLAQLCNYLPYFLFHRLLSPTGQQQWNQIATGIALGVLFAAVIGMIQSFRIMRLH